MSFCRRFSQYRAAPIRCLALILLAPFAAPMIAQNSIQLFGPVDVRLSAAGTAYGSSAVNFNTTTLNLTCPTSPIIAILSSTADGTGNLLVDNNINVSVIHGGTTTGPTNICTCGVSFPIQNCFKSSYQTQASAGDLTGQDPDNFVSTGGVPPISMSELLVPGAEQVVIALQDEGGYLTNSTLYLDTNCTQSGVTGPALVNGNPISSSKPTTEQLAQDFSFNPTTGQQIGFEYDLTTAQAAGSLTITDQTIPQVADLPLDPSTFQSTYLAQTSFATSNCLVHGGEELANGNPACKLFTLACAVGTSPSASGAQCPISTQNNEVFQDVFDGPTFTLADIPTPNGPTFHEGIGFLMASDGWTGGPCTYEAAADLPNLPCPQNLLYSFSSTAVTSSSLRKAPSTLSSASIKAAANGVRADDTSLSVTSSSSGRTTHPNSTFITVAQVPEDLTTVTVSGQLPGYWINSATANVTLSSQPPNLSGTTLPGAANFVASPIQSITYGIASAGSVPVPSLTGLNETTLTSGVVCPTLANPTGVPASTFTPPQQTLTGLADGYHEIYYYAQDCAGTEELQFDQDSSGNWSTSFYTYPINVDTVAPVVASGPTLSPSPSASGTYVVGQVVTASFSCTDALSGVIQCGSYKYAAGATNNTGTLTSTVDTSSPGSKTFTVLAVDAAGNEASQSVTYTVVSPYDNQVHFTISPSTVTYPQGVRVKVEILPGASSSALAHKSDSWKRDEHGTVKILDGTTLLETLHVHHDDIAHGELRGLSAGKHILSAVYSGDASVPGGTSAPVTLTVLPAPVALRVHCWSPVIHFGENYSCSVYAGSDEGPARGDITYQIDDASPVKAPLEWGNAFFAISKPALGKHTVVVQFAAQGNYAAATAKTENFDVTPAP